MITNILNWQDDLKTALLFMYNLSKSYLLVVTKLGSCYIIIVVASHMQVIGIDIIGEQYKRFILNYFETHFISQSAPSRRKGICKWGGDFLLWFLMPRPPQLSSAEPWAQWQTTKISTTPFDIRPKFLNYVYFVYKTLQVIDFLS